MKSTTKQENNRTLKRTVFSYLNVQALARGVQHCQDRWEKFYQG